MLLFSCCSAAFQLLHFSCYIIPVLLWFCWNSPFAQKLLLLLLRLLCCQLGDYVAQRLLGGRAGVERVIHIDSSEKMLQLSQVISFYRGIALTLPVIWVYRRIALNTTGNLDSVY
jgi:hypothetical protein